MTKTQFQFSFAQFFFSMMKTPFAISSSPATSQLYTMGSQRHFRVPN